ncbi:hypothetical protein JTB14_029067 [Gonioctena quinquepunctata]|nr:hypothetical protein JTB14_029067 [Gonioctena quinquepunctata]
MNSPLPFLFFPVIIGRKDEYPDFHSDETVQKQGETLTFHFEETRTEYRHVMKRVVSSVNFIKSRGLNHRQFQDLESKYGNLVFNCQVRWLSEGNMLKRFHELREEVPNFLGMKEKSILVVPLRDDVWLSDFAFLVYITSYLNELNMNMQI